MAGSGTAHLRTSADSVLRIENLVVEFPVGRSGLKVHAVSNVSIDILPGETLGLVGESGCGKSTMGKAVMQLVHPTSGSVLFEGTELTKLSGDQLRETRPKLQMIFQDPISSLNPRRRVRDIVREGLDIWKLGTKESRAKRVDEVLETVGIDPDIAGPKRPHEFSGGQCQRISIARAVATEPKLIICDEPVSALDVSVQAQILNLLEEMKQRYNLTMLFIAHDLAVVKNVSDRVAVMYLGKLCEVGPPDQLYASPAHPYTAALLSAIPEPDPDIAATVRDGVGGEIPSPLSPPSGCRFRTRCPAATEICTSDEPLMREVRPDHFVACHHPLGDITVTQTVPEAVATAPVPRAAPTDPPTGPIVDPVAPPLP
ncbi:MAG: oligopeptide/dipeptide ABC transporter ATP-binding protein, partial [Acidimicrobiia bacterium]